MKLASLPLSLALLFVAAPTLAQEPAPAPAPSHAELLRLEIGARQAFIADPGFDAFAQHNEFGQLSIAASHPIFARGRFTLAPGLAWDYGMAEASVRGSPSSLTVHRVSIPIEARFSLLPQLYVFTRVAPGAAHANAEVKDASAPAPLVRGAWIASLDASAGATYRLLTLTDLRGRPLDMWLSADGGYGFSRSTELTLSPDLADGDPRRTGAADLGALSLRGAFFRVAAAFTF
jgi:hypothetical protein